MSKNVFGRIVSFALAMITIVSLTACQEQKEPASSQSSQASQLSVSSEAEENLYYNKTGLPICDEPITIKITGSRSSTPDWSKTDFVKEVEDRLGIRLECNMFESANFNDQFAMMLATHNIPDMVVNAQVAKGEVDKSGKEGLFLNLADYMELMPAVQALFDEHENAKNYFYTSEGQLYGLNRIRTTDLGCYMQTAWVPTKWLENVGKEMPTTVDELYDVLKAFKEQDANGNGDPNDEIPMSYELNTTSSYRFEWAMLYSFGLNNTDSYYGANFSSDEDGNIFFTETSENYKAFLKYMNKLFEEGLLDSQLYTATKEEQLEKFKNDLIGFGGNVASMATVVDPATLPDYSLFVNVKSDFQDKIQVNLFPDYTSGMRVMVGANTEYPEAICRLIDYFYTEEGVELANNGIEGVNFEYIEDSYGRSPSWQKFAEAAGYESANTFKNERATVGQGFQFLITSESDDMVRAADDQKLAQMVADREVTSYVVQAQKEKMLRTYGAVNAYPILNYTEAEDKERSQIITDMRNYVKTKKSAFIQGMEDIDANWDAFVAEFDKMGLARLTEIEQDAYNRLLGKD